MAVELVQGTRAHRGPETSPYSVCHGSGCISQRKECLLVTPHLVGASFSIRTKVKNMVALGLIIMETFLIN